MWLCASVALWGRASLFVVPQTHHWDLTLCAAVGRDGICSSVSLEDCCWVWHDTLLLSPPVAVCSAPQCISGALGKIWIWDSGILPVCDASLLRTISPKGMFVLPLQKQLFNFAGNLMPPVEQNTLKIHTGIQILTGKMVFSKILYWIPVHLALDRVTGSLQMG